MPASQSGPDTLDKKRLLEALTAFEKGDVSVRLPVDWVGIDGKIADTFNALIERKQRNASEIARLGRVVGKEGKLAQRAAVGSASGMWADILNSVNELIADLVHPTSETARVIGAVTKGDLSQIMAQEVEGRPLEGEFLRNARTVNTMVDQLGSFAAEVTRVAREVGTEGKLGGQADVKGVSGTWNDLTDNVNLMASNLTSQVRNIATVTTAVANGDLSKKITVDVKGEFLELKNTVNTMVDQLNSFASEVTTAAREVGVEGKLGGQASVPGASGTWKDLTDNVNQLAANLTTQVRAIAEVATAVTTGDLTRSIKVEAQGEVAAMKDNINEMIRNLKDTTIKNTEQDWLKTNLAKFSFMLQGQKDLLTVGRLILSELAPVISIQQGLFYTMDSPKNDDGAANDSRLKLLASYAFASESATELKLGEGLVGQCAVERRKILLHNLPKDYVRIASGLGSAPPQHVLVLPVLFEGQVKAVMELASFERFSATHEMFLDQLAESIGIVINTIAANTRTEDLLKQSQSQAKELLSQQQELQNSNHELKVQTKQLAEQNVEVERKNQQVEQSRAALEEKATQLALTSKYKSEFLANMSHELRTPLNSLLILSEQLSRNQDSNLTPKQVEYAKTIHASGDDLLSLINDILDLSKIESGTVTVDPEDLSLRGLSDYVERTFRHVAEARGLELSFKLDQRLPKSIYTDAKRLQQVLKNLLSNAFKFTEKGKVEVRVETVVSGWNPENQALNHANGGVLAFAVADSGIGIHPDKQRIIFEAFQQADGSTSRKYGGTGLGLAISREISRLLGGEIRLDSTPGSGSTFTLFLPRSYTAGKALLNRSAPADPAPPAVLVAASSDHAAPAAPVGDLMLVKDDRVDLQSGDRSVLIVENDLRFAKFLLDMTRTKGFRGLVAARAGVVVALAKEYNPVAITLDINLPDSDGWKVLQQLKADLVTRHIPVHIISVDDNVKRGLRGGAITALIKPVNQDQLEQMFNDIARFSEQRVKHLLLVEDDPVQRQHIEQLVTGDDVQITAVGTGQEALAALGRQRFDCMVLDFGLPDMSGEELLERMHQQVGLHALPVILHTALDLTKAQEIQARKDARAIVVKDYRAPERLLDGVAHYLHRNQAELPGDQSAMIDRLHEPQAVLTGKRVLVVDDDIRNIFAMTSLLENYQIAVRSAENGKDAIALLQASSGTGTSIDLVLMDIMMPEMDGYETMRRIRADPRFADLPIIAVTAKAMKGDREKCIEAGASDYIAKPVDSARLSRMLSLWLYQVGESSANQTAVRA